MRQVMLAAAVAGTTLVGGFSGARPLKSRPDAIGAPSSHP